LRCIAEIQTEEISGADLMSASEKSRQSNDCNGGEAQPTVDGRGKAVSASNCSPKTGRSAGASEAITIEIG
jgi:hypothetical protein